MAVLRRGRGVARGCRVRRASHARASRHHDRARSGPHGRVARDQPGRPAVLASWILVIGLSVIVTQRAWITGGIHAPVAVFYVLFIVMAGVLLEARCHRDGGRLYPRRHRAHGGHARSGGLRHSRRRLGTRWFRLRGSCHRPRVGAPRGRGLRSRRARTGRRCRPARRRRPANSDADPALEPRTAAPEAPWRERRDVEAASAA